GVATVVPSPNGGNSYPGICYANQDALVAITARAPDDLWAVGSYFAPTSLECENFFQTLTIHWDGVNWTLVNSANNPALFTDSVLRAAAAAGAGDVWAVGYTHNLSGSDSPLAEHWNGSAWSLVSVPDPEGGAGYTTLNGVAAVASNDVWAVGTHNSYNN